MNEAIGVVKMHMKDHGTWLIAPWAPLVSSFAVNVIVALFIDDAFSSGGLASIYFGMLVAGVIAAVQTFPFAIGLSVRRADYFWGTVGTTALASAAFAIVLSMLSVAEKATDAWGIGLYFFNVAGIGEGTALGQIAIHFVVLVHVFFVGFSVAGVHLRFGRTGLFVLFVASSLLLSALSVAATYYEWWGPVWQWLVQHSAPGVVAWMLPAAIVYMFASHRLLRKATA